MRIELIILLLPTLALAAPPPVQTCDLVRVVDGDTIVCDIDGVREHVRLYGIDTPEMHGGNCRDRERPRAEAATHFTSVQVFAARHIELERLPGQPDRVKGYGNDPGRLLRRVMLYAPGQISGRDLSGLLLAARDSEGRPLAVPFREHRNNWCNED